MTLSVAARSYLRWGLLGRPVPFLHQGRNPDIGIDCIGLLVLACRDCGIPVMDVTSYGRNPVNGELERQLRLHFGPPKDSIQADDFVTIDYKGATRHVAIVGHHPDGLSLIHTSMSHGRVTEHRIDRKWTRRITGVYRVTP